MKHKVLDVSCGDKFTLVLTTDKKSKYESEYYHQFKENIREEAIKSSKFKGRAFERKKYKPDQNFVNLIKTENYNVNNYNKMFEKLYGAKYTSIN